MTTLEALYLQDPFWIWLGVAALFVSLSLASGSNMLFLPSVCAVIVAAVEIVGLRAGIEIEAAIFVALTAFAVVGAYALQPRAKIVLAGTGGGRKAGGGGAASETPAPLQASALVGRIARATSEFANGVGRVWIDGHEWSAELEGVEESLPPDASVRVIRVVGGVKLLVRGLEAVE